MTPTIELQETATQDLGLDFEELQKHIHKIESELQNKEANLQAALGREQTLEQTRAFIAHEFRNTIVPLSVNAQMLAEELAKPDFNKEKLEKLAQRIIRQSHAASEIIDEYVDYSRPLKPDFELVNIGGILTQVLEEYEVEYKRRNIRILTLMESAMVTVDRQMMAQVFRNLFSNTLEAIEEQGNLVINVTATVVNRFVVVCFSDTGPGFSSEYLSRAFELGLTTRAGKRGAGIGLALSQRLVQANGGYILIENWDLEVMSGARVFIFLPNPQSEQLPTTNERVVLRKHGK